MTRYIVAVLLIFLLAAPPVAASPSAAQHVFLVQNSGWMEPFYTDPDSQLKPLVAALARTVVAPGEAFTVLAFNQRTLGNDSPVEIYRGSDASGLQTALVDLEVARRNDGALADTDFQEAVSAAIGGALGGRSGIIWIFTNNRNSPGNDSDTIARNRDFYNLIHLEPSISRSLIFPLGMSVVGRHYEASGLMVYALAYGEQAGARLQALVDGGVLSRVFTNPPARLKPLDRDAVRIVPDRVINSDNIKVTLGGDGRTLIFDIGASEAPALISIQAQLQNLFYPYEIATAAVSAELMLSGGQRIGLRVDPAAINDLAPGEARRVQLDLQIPETMVPSAWSVPAILAMGKRVTLPAAVEIRLDNQRLRVAESFRQSVAELFPGDPLHDVFTPPETSDASVVSIPIQLQIQYPLWPLLVIMGLLASALGAAFAFMVLIRRPQRYEALVDGQRRLLLVGAFKTAELHDTSGMVVARIRRGAGRAHVIFVAEGHQVSISRS